ncbi:MlaD family protein [Amycolatopsis keratiniphila]|uniref:MlaD family protein n=1 Tax=Amycolatopsis keratiniphila TaxID=129921 RepID=UPI00087BAEB7|nr:MlaD family protein [Amycolatopsis keratiniphila]OLZ42944.1 organic solvent ABC transporter substrate-bindng protein [Amycolatopsis keratiniphila subsp. nogabecina]SDU66320.1 phospholipid/cholesterol/gamma-HCH transport system substrate-binding protein [Amycolatopsis keratiniphila]
MNKQTFRSPRWSRPASYRLRGIAVVTVACVGVTAGAVGVNDKGQPGELTIVAKFADASPLIPGNEVKVNGVNVGQVAAMTVDSDKHAAVALSLDPAALPVHTDAKITLKPVSILGERYLDLDRGTASAPVLRDGDVLPVQQTSVYTDLDEVLNTIDDPTGQSLAALVTVLGEGLRGNGQNADATIQALASSMKNTGGLVKVLKEQNGLLNSVVDKVEPVAQALAVDNGTTLDGLLSSAKTATEATAKNRAALEATLTQLPDTLSVARTTLSQLTGTARATTPVLQSIRPTTDNLSAISDELKKFSESLDPALASAKPVLDKAQGLLDEARPVVDQLKAAGPDLRTTVGSARPVVTGLTNNFGNVLNFIRNWALTTNGGDGISHYFRAMLVVNPDLLTGLVPGLNAPNGAPTPPQQGPPQGDSGTPSQEAPALPLPTLPGLTGQGGVLGGLLATGQQTDGGVTGLSQQQESGVLQFLIGGGQ